MRRRNLLVENVIAICKNKENPYSFETFCYVRENKVNNKTIINKTFFLSCILSIVNVY